jgi:NAD(P)-dependent dehydrogenase (short-subunit alcohol dehydrogenase family)
MSKGGIAGATEAVGLIRLFSGISVSPFQRIREYKQTHRLGARPGYRTKLRASSARSGWPDTSQHPTTRKEIGMNSFEGKIAVITGGGSGMGRELARQLMTMGCDVAICDVFPENMADTRQLCMSQARQGTRISTFAADVSIEDQVLAFAEAVKRDLDTDHIHLLFNNAGIGGGGSFVDGRRAEWDKTFSVCWHGVYYCTRAFLPLLRNADEGHIVNTSSVNGFWASLGPARPHTSYCAAKFAVQGFTEALITDLSLNAPHIKCSVVMPGHIGTDISRNSRKILRGSETAIDISAVRKQFARQGIDVTGYSDDQIRARVAEMDKRFHDGAPTSAAEAATIILDGVRAERWRILVGKDAEFLDDRVRAAPEEAYSPAFHEAFRNGPGWRI